MDFNLDLIGTGSPGLDTILQGGLPKGRTYLVEGQPGSGKTTLSMQFLLEGARAGERVMLVSLIETREELFQLAKSHGWDLEGVHILKLPEVTKDSVLSEQTVFPPSDVEFGELANAVIEGIESYLPDRLAIDSVSQLFLLTDNWYQMRSSIIKIRDLIHKMGCTTLLINSALVRQNAELNTIVNGTISLEIKTPTFGQIRRQLIIKKIRGHKFTTGYHNFRILTGGLDIFTWPAPKQKSERDDWVMLSSGIQGIDEMLGGGLEEGTACLLTGSTGSGKSTLASLFVQAAAKRGENSIVFCFDERRETFLRRCASLNMDIPAYVEQGLVDLHQVDAGEMSPGEFSQAVQRGVEKKNAKVVLLDSLSGYLNSMPEEILLMSQLHELLSYLSGANVLTIMVVTKFGASEKIESDINASYLADTVIVLRHFEALGNIRRCVAVLKKRHGSHEHTIREFRVSKGGCEIGNPLTGFNNVLTGSPVYVGKVEDLLD